MERYAWKGRIKEECLDEYIRRHNEIWPEMKDMLNDAGIKNYTIWNVGDEMFGYYECDLRVITDSRKSIKSILDSFSYSFLKIFLF